MRQLLRPPRGFTLIEVMIVLIVLAILAAIAYPSFVGFLIRTDRADAREALAAVQLAQERYRRTNSVYADDVADLGLSSVSPKGLYDIAIVVDEDIPTPSRDTFTVIATPVPGSRQERDSAACQELVLTVSPTGATRTPAECW